MSCYQCGMGDPHTVHLTAEEFFGLPSVPVTYYGPPAGSIGAPAYSCPWCEAPLHRWYGQVSGDPDDSEPHAECSNPDCDYWY